MVGFVALYWLACGLDLYEPRDGCDCGNRMDIGLVPRDSFVEKNAISISIKVTGSPLEQWFHTRQSEDIAIQEHWPQIHFQVAKGIVCVRISDN